MTGVEFLARGFLESIVCNTYPTVYFKDIITCAIV